MSSPFVKFPGTSGNYVFTADVNLLDADTAHLYQSYGEWDQNAGASPSVVTDDDAFGGKAAEQTPTGFDTFYKFPNVATILPISGSTEYSVSISIKSLGIVDAAHVTVAMDFRNVGGTAVGGATSSEVALVANEYVDVSLTATSPATATYVRLFISNGAADTFAGNDTWRLGSACFRAGSDGTFVPSLRIVGDLDMRAKAAADDWTSGNRALMSNYNSSKGFHFYHDNSGDLHVQVGGVTSVIDEASALFTFVDGQTAEVRATLDVSAGNLVWYQSGVQVDTDTFTAQALDPATNQLSVAADYLGTTLLFDGGIFYCELRDGIGGPVVARFDAGDVLRAL